MLPSSLGKIDPKGYILEFIPYAESTLAGERFCPPLLFFGDLDKDGLLDLFGEIDLQIAGIIEILLLTDICCGFSVLFLRLMTSPLLEMAE